MVKGKDDMYRNSVFVLFVSISTLWGTVTVAEISIIPKPAEIEVLDEKALDINSDMVILSGPQLKNEARYLKDLLSPATGFNLPVKREYSGENIIKLTLNEKLAELGQEGYRLRVKKTGIYIEAFQPTGIFYGIQTLRQLLPAAIEQGTLQKNIKWSVPAVSIMDKPRFGWRGLMIDCSRTFWSKDFIKRYIDLLARYKMNVLHWHLVDDQGWRLESKVFPELTKKGAYFPAEYKEPAERHGFYSQEDIREIIEHARFMHVQVVPEIETPGHCLAMLNAYPELSCTAAPHKIHPFGKGPNIHPDIMCAGNEEVFNFLNKLFKETTALFPGEFFHIGGDEAPKDRWEECPKCQKRIKDEKLHGEGALQSYLMKRAAIILDRNKKRSVVWGELDVLREGGYLPSAAVMVWRAARDMGHGRTKQLVEKGYDVIFTVGQWAYFDYSYKTVSSKRVYNGEPIPFDLPKEKHKHILGMQACFWSHIDRTEDKMDRKIFPRLGAMAEAAWTPRELKEWPDFQERLKADIVRQKILGINVYPEKLDDHTEVRPTE